MKLTAYYSTLLQSTFSGTNLQVKSAETELRVQFKNELFLQSMLEILLKYPDMNLKLSVANIFKEYSRYLINNSQQILLQKFVESVTSILKSSPLNPPLSLPLKIVMILCDNLKSIFTLDPIHTIRLQVIRNLIIRYQTIRQNSYSCNQSECFYLVILTRSLISSPMFDHLNNNLFRVSFDVLSQLSSKTFASSMEKQQTFTSDVATICKLISQLLFYYVRRTDIKSNQVIQEIIWSPKLQNMLLLSLKSTFQLLKGIYQEPENNTQIQNIMSIQANTFQLMEIIMRYRLSQEHKDKFQYEILAVNNDIIQSIKMCLDVDSDKFYTNEKTLTTVTKIIRLYETLVRYPSHSNYFSKNMDIYKTVIFPLLEIPLVLKESYSDKPDAFINFFNYVFDSSMIDDDRITDPLLSLKTSISQFVVMSIEFVGILETVIQFCLQVLRTNTEFRDRSICMIVLGIISYNVRNRPNFLNSIKQFLETEINQKMVIGSDIDSQILQILSMMLVSKFLLPICDDTFAHKVFKFILNILGTFSSEPHRVLALEILTEVIKFQGDLKDSTQKLIEYLLNVTSNPHEAVRVLDILSEIYCYNSTLKSNFPLSIKIAHYFISKIKSSAEGREPLAEILHNKCWNMINSIVEIDALRSKGGLQFVRAVEKQVVPLYAFFQSQDLFNLKESIINFNLSLLVKTQEVSYYQRQFILNLPVIIEKNKDGISLVYEFLMLFIKYGCNLIQQSQELQNIIFLECAKSSYILFNAQSEKQTAGIKGIILLQILLLHSNRMNPDSIELILDKIINLVQNCHIYYTFTKSNLVSFLVFCLVNIPSITNEEIINQILKIAFNQYDCVNVNFSSKVYVLALCTLFRREQLSSSVKFNQRHTIIKAITQVLIFSLKNTTQSQDDEEIQYFQNVKLIINNIPKIDEIQYFKHMILNLKQTNPQEFHTVMASVDDYTRENLSTLLRTEFVHAAPREILKVDRRAIS